MPLSASGLNLRSGALLAGDLVCFLLFALLGLRSHEDSLTAGGLLRAAVPFQAGWLVFALALGLYRPDARPRAPRVFAAWVPAWAVGLALRSLLFGRAFAPTFAVISFVTNAVILLAWRSILAPRLLPPEPAAPRPEAGERAADQR